MNNNKNNKIVGVGRFKFCDKTQQTTNQQKLKKKTAFWLKVKKECKVPKTNILLITCSFSKNS